MAFEDRFGANKGNDFAHGNGAGTGSFAPKEGVYNNEKIIEDDDYKEPVIIEKVIDQAIKKG